MKRHFKMVFGACLLDFVLLLPPAFAETVIPDSVDTVISNAIYQVKIVLMRKLASGDVEDMINRGRNAGVTGYKLNHYAGGQMGWSVADSKGREVFSVIFSFVGFQAREGTYFGPLMSFRDAKEIHKQHRQVLSGHFKQIGADTYDVGDNCMAFTELFKGSAGAGRTKITIKCH